LTSLTQAENYTTMTITYTSCDSEDYPGNLGVSDVINKAVATNVSAMVFYSKRANFCNITGPVGAFTYFYSMTRASDSNIVYNYLAPMSKAQSNPTMAIILTQNAYETTQNTTSLYGALSATKGGKTTAIAMIALYAITGLITILFLIIIVTGAIRAHRHPDRYGPRNIIGRARQSRAKGLARAMLDTLPIIKFGDPLPAKHGDVEMTDATSFAAEEGRIVTPAVPTEQGQAAKNTTTAEHDRATSALSTDGEGSGTRTDATIPIADNAEQEGQMCSICTDEFNKGEDIRVLPCNHVFHPACVDPWLLDVSGTCPLCRINLNPKAAAEVPTEDATADVAPATGLAPPLDRSSGRRAHVWRALFGEQRHPAAPQQSNPQETVAALRAYRQANIGRAVDAENDPVVAHQEAQEESRRRRFFSRRARTPRTM
jgi:hypothetical protein